MLVKYLISVIVSPMVVPRFRGTTCGPEMWISPLGLGPLLLFPAATLGLRPKDLQQGWNMYIFFPENLELHPGN